MNSVVPSCIPAYNVQIIPCQRTYPSFGHAIVDIHHMYDAWKESDFLEVCTLQAPIRTSRTVRGVNEPTTGGPAILPFSCDGARPSTSMLIFVCTVVRIIKHKQSRERRKDSNQKVRNRSILDASCFFFLLAFNMFGSASK